jgi:hypothetical protein
VNFEEKIKEFWCDWLVRRGWSTWYNPEYWVHPDSVEDPAQQDYTNYGMTWEDALQYERIGKPKHRPMGLPGLSRMQMAIATEGLTKMAEEE